MSTFAGPIERLINELNKLPGVGPKTAQRLAFYLLKVPLEEARSLARAIIAAREEVRYCSVCGDLTDVDPCRICADPRRDHSVICVVEDSRDLAAMERSREFKGVYHVLQGAISPMDGIGPEEIRVKELLDRIAQGQVQEVVLATNPTVEGEATAMYLAKLLKPLGPKVSRLAHGLPIGGDLEYTDAVTIARALSGRREL